MFPIDRKCKAECRAFAFLAFYPDMALLPFDNFCRDMESQTKTWCGSLLIFFNSVEGIKDFVVQSFWNTRAEVLDAKRDGIRIGERFYYNTLGAGSILHGIS